jgi:Leu/Phe-tRNA-protein transferase
LGSSQSSESSSRVHHRGARAFGEEEPLARQLIFPLVWPLTALTHHQKNMRSAGSSGTSASLPSSSPSAAPASAGLPPPWDALTVEQLRTLICEQIPRFQQRPYLIDESALHDAERRFDFGFEGDFCWSLCFSARFLQALSWHGFLPICCELGGGTGLFVLLPKLHITRCVLHFDNLHVSKKVARRARKYVLTVDDAFDQVLAGCLEQHGASWLHPPLRDAFAKLAPPPPLPTPPPPPPPPQQAQGLEPRDTIMSSDAWNARASEASTAGGTELSSAGSSSSSRSSPDSSSCAPDGGGGIAPTQACCPARASAGWCASAPPLTPPLAPFLPPQPPDGAADGVTSEDDADASHGASHGASPSRGRMCSFALWLDGKLVAGEFGALVGRSYTSYSGFYRLDGAGAAQMALTALVLQRAGFAFWDMGQEHAYKLHHGATLMPRAPFLALFRGARAHATGLDLLTKQHGGRFLGSELLRQLELPTPAPDVANGAACSGSGAPPVSGDEGPQRGAGGGQAAMLVTETLT